MLRDADVQVLVVDVSLPFPEDLLGRLETVIDARRTLFVASKADLSPQWDAARRRVFDQPAIVVSAGTGSGIDGMRQALARHLAPAGADEENPALFTEALRRRVSQWVSDLARPESADIVRKDMLSCIRTRTRRP
jgi:tRNA U34 5-carboxymethylaminomethyl modifying GTPase MnmE/TrmE